MQAVLSQHKHKLSNTNQLSKPAATIQSMAWHDILKIQYMRPVNQESYTNMQVIT